MAKEAKKKSDREIFKELYKPFPLDRVKFRVGATTKKKDKCIPLAYVDARDVIQRLNNVFGASWESSQTDRGGCSLTLPFSTISSTRVDDAGETKVEAEKGKYSGAFKRAAVHFGVGLYLYYFPNVYVGYNGYGIDMNNGNFVVNGREESPFLDWMDPDKWDEYCDIFLDDRVEELKPMEEEYLKRFKWTTYTSNSTNASPKNSNKVKDEPVDSVDDKPTTPSGGGGNDNYNSFKWPFGKYKDTLVSKCMDDGYLAWAVSKCENPQQLVVFKRRLEELTS